MLALFGKKKNAIADYTSLHTDVHSHLVPGIDDGAAALEESLEMIAGLMALGYTKAITTPHIYADFYPNTPTTITQGLVTVQAAIADRGWAFRIEAAAEYFLDVPFLELLQTQPLLTFGKQYLLFETSHQQMPANLAGIVAQMRAKGYLPVLAHPERYSWCWDRYERYAELRTMGLLFQCNINSFSGHYSPVVKKAAEHLANSRMVDLLGSDAHGMRHIALMQRSLENKHLQQLLTENTLLNKTL